jgi:uncharacterized protein YndB with AHSA1/START domain
METSQFELSVSLAAPPRDVYDAWLDAEEHAAFTGDEASCDPHVDGAFSAWDGYITGRNLVLEPGQRIVQAWRTTDFAPDAPDSKLELIFDADGEGGTRLTLRHSGLPAGDDARYKEGWREFYFEGMRVYFSDDEGDDAWSDD